MSHAPETIAAVSTPPGRGGIGIVRVSGSRVPDIAERLLGRLPAPRAAVYRSFRDADGRVVDRGIALYFPAPRSFTGEDVLELHGHGGPVVMDMVLAAVLAAGARPARAGEFTERAFLNERMDLSQAEAVADLIDSASREAARSALRTLEGALSERAADLAERLTGLRVHVEAAMDFPEEEIDFLADESIAAGLDELDEALAAIRGAAARGATLREGLRVVLAGVPNVGKSSLLNALAGRAAAIVTDVPGTTRDLVREHIHLDGLPLHVVDTAGIRDSDDAVEREGVARARAAIAEADALLLMVDDRTGIGAAEQAILAGLPEVAHVILVRNKIDLSGAPPGRTSDGEPTVIRLSARTGAGVDALADTLKACAGYLGAGEGLFMARRRHLVALDATAAALAAARRALTELRAGELAAEELRAAQRALGEITGEITSEDLLGRIFASFCIGK